MAIRGVLWDLDGTLLDTLGDLTDAVNATMAHYGCPPRSTREVRRFLGNGAGRLIALSLPGLPTDPPFAEALAWYTRYYDAHCRIKTAPYPGIPQALKALKAAGLQMAILTNKPDPTAKALRSEFFPETMAFAQGESPDCPRKPDPAMVLRAMDELKLKPEETVYVGDSEVDLATARAAGLPCYSVLWGFRDREELVQAGATTLCATPEELKERILHG